MTLTFTVKRKALGKDQNQRLHWAARAKLYKAERASTVGAAMVARCYTDLPMLPHPVHVTFTYIGKRALDTDQVVSRCAAIRDQVAEMLGVTDAPNDKRVSWHYAAQKIGEYAVDVVVRGAEETAGRVG